MNQTISQQSTNHGIETGMSRHGNAMTGTGKVLLVGQGPSKSSQWPKLKVVFRHCSNRHKRSHQADKFIAKNQPIALKVA
jgi:hypothetical protein